MTEVDETLLTLAKLREVVQGNLDQDNRLHPHTGVVLDESDRASLSFCESIDFGDAGSFADTELGQVVTSKFETDAGTKAVVEELPGVASHLVGVTEQEFDGSTISTTLTLLEEMVNNGAPAYVTMAGDPNTGKTNTMAKLVEIADGAGNLVEDVPEDLLVVSNAASWSRTDLVVRSMHDLMVALLEHRDQPKIVVVDEGSTHFDAGTNRYEVRSQWTPAAKRFAKLHVWMAGVIGHTGKDLHPEVKRMTTLAVWKNEPTEAEFFEEWDEDESEPESPLFQDGVSPIEAAMSSYDPDDAAPWSWNLQESLFSEDLDWDGLLDLLRDRDPTEKS